MKWTKNLNTLKKSSLKIFFIIFIFCSITKTGGESSNAKDYWKKYELQQKEVYGITTLRLIQEINYYIKSNGEGSLLSAELIVYLSDFYNIDIKLVLAQGQLESQFGTKGMAAKTNSVFNVGTYDNGTILYTYKDPNHSVEPYMKLLRTKYLVGKEISNLLNESFVDINGKRYATNITYEEKLINICNKIESRTKIDSLIQVREHTKKYLGDQDLYTINVNLMTEL
jgi:hypothetical protein